MLVKTYEHFETSVRHGRVLAHGSISTVSGLCASDIEHKAHSGRAARVPGFEDYPTLNALQNELTNVLEVRSRTVDEPLAAKLNVYSDITRVEKAKGHRPGVHSFTHLVNCN